MPEFFSVLTPFLQPILLFFWILLLSFFFAKVEIHIEGEHGWAESLPTWRIEKHWLLTLFWGGRPMTGYHAWVFSFMALVFHLPMFLTGEFAFSYELRILGSLTLFWVIEDFFWFAFNPAYGLGKFFRREVKWHKLYILWLPHDYWIFLIVGSALVFCSYWFFRD